MRASTYKTNRSFFAQILKLSSSRNNRQTETEESSTRITPFEYFIVDFYSVKTSMEYYVFGIVYVFSVSISISIMH